VSFTLDLLLSFVFDVFVGLRSEAWSAESKKDEIVVAKVGDSLTAERRYEHDIAWADFLRRQVADLHETATFEDDVAFSGVFQPVPARGDADDDTRSSDGELGIVGPVRKFVYKTKL